MDNLDLIGFIVRNFHACDFLDQYYQLKTVEPVSSQIAFEMSIISDMPDIDLQMLSDQNA